MRTTKNLISIVLVILILCNSVCAADNSAEQHGYMSVNSTIQPRYTYVTSVGAGLSMDQFWGIATCMAIISVRDADTVMVHCLLQRFEDGGWTTIKAWTHTDRYTAYVDEQYAVYRGYTYRVRVTGYALDSAGNVLETVTKYSTYETL